MSFEEWLETLGPGDMVVKWREGVYSLEEVSRVMSMSIVLEDSSHYWRDDGTAIAPSLGCLVQPTDELIQEIKQADTEAHMERAAPDLYEALRAIIEEPENEDLYANGRAALRKARGEVSDE